MARKYAPEELNGVMEFDQVIRVHANGMVETDLSTPYPPELHDGKLMGGHESWRLMAGHSNQHGYRGPIMHPSEYIGGGMARVILETPGVYVALVDYPGDGSEPGGWAVATIPAG